MQCGGNVHMERLHFGKFEGVIHRHQARLRKRPRQIAENGGDFSHHSAPGNQRWHPGGGIDQPILRSQLLALGKIHLQRLVGRADFFQGNMGHQRTGARVVEQLHEHYPQVKPVIVMERKMLYGRRERSIFTVSRLPFNISRRAEY